MTTGLFLDEQRVNFEFEKTSSEVMLPEDPNVWPNEILQELYKQVSYIADFVPKVVPAVIDGEKGYGFGHIEVTSKTGAQNPTPQQEDAAGIRHVRIPFLIKDRKLMPLDLLLTEGSKLMPLTESRMRQALFRPQSFDVTSKTPGDVSLIGQLYPPYRQNYGFGGAGGVVNIGMGKMGSVDELNAWLLGEHQAKEASDVESAARKIRKGIKGARRDPMGTVESVFGMKTGSAADPRLPGEDRRFTGPKPDYTGIKSPTNKTQKTAGAAAKAAIGAGALGAGLAIGHHMGSKGRPGREGASGRYKSKHASIIPAILTTINETDFHRLASAIDEPEVKLAFLQNEDASKALAPLGNYKPVSAEKRAAAFMSAVKNDVAQVRRLGPGEYEIKVASHRFWAPRATRLDRGQLVDLVGSKLAMDVDTNGSVTMAEDAQVDAVSPEQDKLAPITDFGLYRVQTGEGRELVGYVFPNLIDSSGESVPLFLFTNGSEYAMQADIAGVRAGEGMAIPEGEPQGHGAFFRVLPNGKAEATVPVTIKGQGPTGGYMVEAFDGAPINVTPQPGIDGFAMAGDTLVVPEDVRWLDLDQAQEVQLVEQPGEPGQKEAMARAISVDIRATDPDCFSLSGPPVEKLAYAETQMLSFDDASFLLAGLGLKPEFAMNKLSEAAFAGKPVTVPTCRAIKTAGERMAQGLERAQHKIASSPVPRVGFLVKEAAMIPDTTSVDAVLSLGFLNEENVFEFLKSLPVLEDAQLRMSELLYASRVGLQDIPDQALERAIRATEKVIEGLKVLAFTEN